jgi:phage gp36-like protein
MAVTVYVEPQALVDEFGERELTELTDVGTPRAGEVDYAVAQRACDRVNIEVAAAVSARYALPLASVPEVLRYVALDMAHYYLYQTEPPSWVQTRFDAARKMLRDIQSGALPLGVDATGTSASAASQNLPVFDSGGKAFGREAL